MKKLLNWFFEPENLANLLRIILIIIFFIIFVVSAAVVVVAGIAIFIEIITNLIL